MNHESRLRGLRAYAAMLNTLDADRLEPFLAEDFVYESQMVLTPLTSKRAFMDYMRPKLEIIRRTNAPVFAELGRVYGFKGLEPCVILAQHSPDELLGVVLAQTDGTLLKRLDLCIIPPPQSAERSGEYPR